MALFHRARREDLASRLERKGSELSQTAAEKGAETSRRVADILRRAADDIRSVEIDSYKEKVMDTMEAAREHVEEHADNARDKIRMHPLASVAVAVGLGILAGAAVAVVGSRIASKYEY